MAATWVGYLGLGVWNGTTFTESTSAGYARAQFGWGLSQNGKIQGVGNPIIFTSTGVIPSLNAWAFFLSASGGIPLLIYPLGINANYNSPDGTYVVNPYAMILDRIDMVNGAGQALDPNAATEIAAMCGIGPLATSQAIAGVNVTDYPYYAIDDGVKGYFTTTWVSASNNLTLLTANLSVTVANTGSYNGTTVAIVTFPGLTSGMGINVGAEWLNRPIAINGAGTAGATLVGKVVDFYLDYANAFTPTLKLNVPAPTPITASTQNIACPCFTTGNDGSGVTTSVGKQIWISNAGSTSSGTANPQKSTPFRDTIATVVSPFAITTTGNIGAPSVTAIPGSLVVWGTNNSAVCVTAGLAAVAAGRKHLFFPGYTTTGSTGLFCLFDWITNVGVASQANYNASVAMSALHWITTDAETYVTSATGANGNQTSGNFQDLQVKKGVAPFNAPPIPMPKIGIQGSMHMPRCSSLNTITVVVTGDSWGVQSPSGQSNDHYSLLAAELQRQNPGKVIHMINRAVSGATWQWFASVPASTAVFPGWYTVHATAWLSYIQTVPVDGLGSVTPDLVVIYLNGNNDGQNSGVYKSDMVSAIATIKSWTKANGFPPDVLMTVAGTKTTENYSNGSSEAAYLAHESATSFVRSFARSNNYGLMDFGGIGAMVVEGWAPDQLMLKQVPLLAAGTATATAPYSCQYLTRDFYFAFELGTNAQTGTSFWSTAGTLSLTLSHKRDNRLWLGTDGSGNLQVCAIAWGMPVTTTCAITSGAAALVTSGQTTLSPTAQFVIPAAPKYTILNNASTFSSGMVGQCILAPGVMLSSAATTDYRSYITAFQNTGIVFACDSNIVVTTTNSIFTGGQMFVSTDATGSADIIVGGAGATTHMLTGASSLVTKVSSYASKTSVGLANNASATLSASAQTVFLGSVTVAPTFDTAIVVNPDSGANPVLTVQKKGNHIRVGYISGGATLTNIRSAVLNGEVVIWEGDVECAGGPFIPQLFAGASVTVQAVYAWLGERDQRMPTTTERELWGTADSNISYPYGGDTSHLSHIGLSRLVDPIVGRQNWSMGNSYGNNNGTNTPLTGFSLTIPSNQTFTAITPAGTLASGTVVLPAIFPQGGRIEINSSQIVTALTVSPPTGFTIAGTAATAFAANGTIAYRLQGTVFIRVQ